jgi:hypothetical protein
MVPLCHGTLFEYIRVLHAGCFKANKTRSTIGMMNAAMVTTTPPCMCLGRWSSDVNARDSVTGRGTE